MTSYQKLRFTPPAGSIPENVTPGKSFDVVCTFTVSSDGSISLSKLGDADLAKDESDDKPGDYKDMADAMRATQPAAEPHADPNAAAAPDATGGG